MKIEKVTLGNLSATEVARDRTDEIQAGNLYPLEICYVVILFQGCSKWIRFVYSEFHEVPNQTTNHNETDERNGSDVSSSW